MDRYAELRLFLQEKRGQAVSLIPALHKARELYGELTVDVERAVAEGLGLPRSRVEAAATFFSAFNGMDDGNADDRYLRSTADPSRPAWLMEHPTGYVAARKVIDENIDMIALLRAGKVRGKSGSGFPVADKWELTKNTESIPKLALRSTAFLKDQSCGMCTACRYGLSDLTDCLQKLCGGDGTAETLEQAKNLCEYIGQNARCALGQAAPTALRTALRQFPEEFEALRGKEDSCVYDLL